MSKTETKQKMEAQLAEARAVAHELEQLSTRLHKATEDAARALGMDLRKEVPDE